MASDDPGSVQRSTQTAGQHERSTGRSRKRKPVVGQNNSQRLTDTGGILHVDALNLHLSNRRWVILVVSPNRDVGCENRRTGQNQ